MSEAAPIISSATASPDAPTIHPPTTENSSQQGGRGSGAGYKRLLIASAIGAAMGFLAGVSVYSEIREKSIEFVVFAILLALAGYVFREPLEAARGAAIDESNTERVEGGLIWALGAAGGVLIVESAFDHSIDAALTGYAGKFARDFNGLSTDYITQQLAAMSGDGIARALAALLVVGLPALLMMYFWIWGAKGPLKRARLGGAIAGLIAGVVAVVAGGFVVHQFQASAKLEDAGIGSWWLWLAGLMAVIWFLGLGILGGWAIDRRRKHSATIELLTYLAVFAGVYVSLLLLLFHFLKVGYSPEVSEFVDRWAWLPVAAVVFQILGWSLALHRQRELCDVVLGSSQWSTHSLSREEGVSSIVAPLIPGPQVGLSNAVNSATTVAPVVAEAGSNARQGVVLDFPHPVEGAVAATRPRTQRAKNLLFRPQGDRLWASVMLVIAMVGAVLAFYLGTLRGDPAILINVAENLQRDSGLSTKGLKVYSEGRVVTIEGRVDNEAEHAKALQEIASVRGVKQLVDQIQVASSTDPTGGMTQPSASQSINGSSGWTAAPDSQPSASGLNATVSVGGGASSGVASSGVTTQKRASAKVADNQKHQGLFHFLQKDKSGQSTDSQKHGFFHFLKKDNKNDKNKARKGNHDNPSQ